MYSILHTAMTPDNGITETNNYPRVDFHHALADLDKAFTRDQSYAKWICMSSGSTDALKLVEQMEPWDPISSSLLAKLAETRDVYARIRISRVKQEHAALGELIAVCNGNYIDKFRQRVDNHFMIDDRSVTMRSPSFKLDLGNPEEQLAHLETILVSLQEISKKNKVDYLDSQLVLLQDNLSTYRVSIMRPDEIRKLHLQVDRKYKKARNVYTYCKALLELDPSLQNDEIEKGLEMEKTLMPNPLDYERPLTEQEESTPARSQDLNDKILLFERLLNLIDKFGSSVDLARLRVQRKLLNESLAEFKRVYQMRHDLAYTINASAQLAQKALTGAKANYAAVLSSGKELNHIIAELKSELESDYSSAAGYSVNINAELLLTLAAKECRLHQLIKERKQCMESPDKAELLPDQLAALVASAQVPLTTDTCWYPPKNLPIMRSST